MIDHAIVTEVPSAVILLIDDVILIPMIVNSIMIAEFVVARRRGGFPPVRQSRRLGRLPWAAGLLSDLLQTRYQTL